MVDRNFWTSILAPLYIKVRNSRFTVRTSAKTMRTVSWGHLCSLDSALYHALIHSFHTLLVFELSVAQLRRLAPISKEGKIWAQGSVKVITETKIRLRHRHIGCLISTKDLTVNCQRQRSDRVSNTDMKSEGFVTLFGDIFGEGFGQLQHLCVLACVERG